SLACGMDVGIGNRPPSALLAGDLVEARAPLLGNGGVVGALGPRGDGGLHERMAQLVGVTAVLDVQRTAGAVVGVAEPGVALGFLEIREHVVIAPSRYTHRRRATRHSRRGCRAYRPSRSSTSNRPEPSCGASAPGGHQGISAGSSD